MYLIICLHNRNYLHEYQAYTNNTIPLKWCTCTYVFVDDAAERHLNIYGNS